MNGWNKFRIAVVILKMCVGAGVIMYLFVSPKLERNPSLKIPQKFNSVSFYLPKFHYFCVPPKGRAMVVNNESILAALSLPDGSKVLDTWLWKYGICRAKVIQAREDPNVCGCNLKLLVPYFLAIVLCIVYFITNLIQLIIWHPLRLRGRLCIFLFSYLGLFFFCGIMVYMGFYQQVSYDRVQLPNNAETQNLLEIHPKGYQFLIAVVIYFGVTIIESVVSVIEHPGDFLVLGEFCTNEKKEIEKFLLLKKIEKQKYTSGLILVECKTWP